MDINDKIQEIDNTITLTFARLYQIETEKKQLESRLQMLDFAKQRILELKNNDTETPSEG